MFFRHWEARRSSKIETDVEKLDCRNASLALGEEKDVGLWRELV